MKKIILTGGHVTPAIATIEEIQLRYPDWQIVFVGRKHALEECIETSEEYRLITAMGIRFVPIEAGRWQFKTFPKVFIGLIQAMRLLHEERPTAVVSFGGYVGFPVALAAKFFGTPVVIHEQTTRPGLANRIIGYIAKHACVTFPETASVFPKNRVTITGLPIRREIFVPVKKPPFTIPKEKPILFVVGGSTGSVSINTVIFDALPKLLDRFIVIHQVGRVSKLLTRGASYIPYAYIPADVYSWLIHHARIVIGRSGANTTLELASVGAVALSIPLPWSSGNEQLYNARFLLSGGGTILSQSDLTTESLVRTINEIMNNWQSYKTKAQTFSQYIRKDGAKHLVDIISRYV